MIQYICFACEVYGRYDYYGFCLTRRIILVQQILPYLFSIPVLLPRNPLKNLNSYVFIGEQRNLLVDTGFNMPECLESMRAGITELNLDMDKTDIFITHCHADHCGLMPEIASPKATIYMGGVDKKILSQYVGRSDDEYWERLDDFYVREGCPPAEMAESRRVNPARNYIPSRNFSSVDLYDGDVFQVDRFAFTCVFTPGHTPGHMCLYNEKEKIMLTGDHVLFDITPNITVWVTMENALEKYLQSLRKIKAYEVVMPLAAHRASNMSLNQRVDELLLHHDQRLEDVVNIIREGGTMDAYQVAARMKWSIRARDWSDFPLSQKRFAVGEAIAHIIYLVDHGRLRRSERAGINYYSVL